MFGGPTVTANVHFGAGRRSRKELKTGEKPAPPAKRIPRIAKLMALAIRFDQLICDGVVTDQAELAWQGHVSRARVTQIMNLLNLATDIQEALLFLPAVEQGRDAMTERELRAVVAEADWGRQRRIWTILR
ncbi:hypothetical protein CA54_60510 [Symmachiella macrocystis]|uniref:Uncharacterized protein n=1 Tax=Symmachiella macrocystis TaxID=2527985 RepID=A0A5C6AYD5_9PLAN|nr:hypothetical protein [Symmachiella macrocystis]TWU04169.1 hypothetical protein CA54_60510 [Symmachiella macrocystis]